MNSDRRVFARSFRGFFTFLALFAITLLCVTAVHAQSSAVTGGLNGVIKDSTGAVVANATVTLVGPQGTTVLKTDSAGRYGTAGLTPGYYDVTVTAPGFSKVSSTHNQVVVNSSSSLSLTLKVGNEGETVQVSTTAASIDTQSTAITNNLTDTFYESIPMPRNVSAIFYAAPGVTQGQVAGTANQVGPGSSNPSIGGSSALENLYIVDGVTITDQAFGSIGTYNRYHGALGTGINLTFIKEVDIKTTAFEPQYGKALGGIVQIVTRSGGNQYHGAIGAYFAPGWAWAASKQYSQFGYQLSTPSMFLSRPQYDVSAEFSGYVPTLKNKLFFYADFNPSLSQTISNANPLAPAASLALGAIKSSITTLSWSGKLTYKLGDRTNLEAASFGDPSKHNSVPSLSSPAPTTTASSWQYGSRDSFFRVDTAIVPSWLVDASYTYNYNHFNEYPSQNIYGISDQSLAPLHGATVATGLGAYEPSKNDTYSIAGNTSKSFHVLHTNHTVSAGYEYDHTNFLDQPARSGNLFLIPTANAGGTALNTLFTIPAKTVGAYTNAQFTVAAANNTAGTSTTDNTCTQCPIWNGERVYASISRGTYVGLSVRATGRYHDAYVNDSVEVNRFLNINAGLRWEQERTGGTLFSYLFNDSWSPRVGFNLDPFGDHKGKFFFNYGRDFWSMPLDAAIRQLGNEQDDTAYYFAPVIVNGALTVVPDNAHTLNGLPQRTDLVGGVPTVTTFGTPSFASSTGEGIIPGTKAEYVDEYVVGFEREVKSGLVIKARYTDRRLGRVVEDVGTQSPEGSVILNGYNGGIANPSPSLDIGVNEQEVTYTPAQWYAANPTPPDPKTGAGYKPPVAGCTWAADTYKGIKTLFTDSYNNQVGGACFLNPSTADNPGSGPNGGDGVSDGFVKPTRWYHALELEVIKRMSNHWMADINYRYGTLWGNYEGAYRNDNGQSDPGISSLFDFTPGKLNLLGNQFQPGYLSSDRHSVANLFLSYQLAKDSRYGLGTLNGLTVGAGLRGQSGVPLSILGDHPIYLNQGEVPVGGRGAAGRTPANVQLDLHADYTVPLSASLADKYKVKLVMDAFNVTNSQYILSKNQYTQLGAAGVGVAPNLNTDYGRPTAFQTAFYARGSIRFEF